MKEESNHQLAVGSVTLKDLEKLDIENNLLNQFNEWKRLP